MERIIAKLSDQQAVLKDQTEALKCAEEDPYSRALEHASSTNSLPITPANEGFPVTAPTTRPASANVNEAHNSTEEVLRLKLELAQAQNQISRLDLELAHTRKPDVDMQGLVPRAGFPVSRDGNVSVAGESRWMGPEDSQSDNSDALSVGFNRSKGIWGNGKSLFPNNAPAPQAPAEGGASLWAGGGRHFSNQGYMEAAGPYAMSDGYRSDRMTPDTDVFPRQGGRRGNRFDSRFPSPHPFGGNFSNFGPPVNQYDPMAGPLGPSANPPHGPPPGMGMYSGYQPQPIGTPLSPHATEFTSNDWKPEVRQSIHPPTSLTDRCS